MIPDLIRPTSRVERREWGKSGHRYKLDGEWVQGVTTILNVIAKPVLIDWAADQVAQFAGDNWSWLSTIPVASRKDLMKVAHNKVRDAAGSRGTALHNAVVPLLAGEPLAKLPDDTDPSVYDLATQAVRFMDEWGIRPILVETVVYGSNPRYAGTLDLVCTADRFPGRVFLVDWKTNKRGIYPEVALQLSAYANADAYVGEDGYDHWMSDLGITDHLALLLKEDSYEVQRTDSSASTFELFKTAAALSAGTSTKNMQALLLDGAIA